MVLRTLLAGAVFALAAATVVAGPAAARDTRAPRIVSAAMEDADGDFRADRLRLTYSERVRHAFDRDGRYPFRVAGYAIGSVGTASGKTIVLALVEATASDDAARPSVAYRRTSAKPVRDQAGNQAVGQVFGFEGVVGTPGGRGGESVSEAGGRRGGDGVASRLRVWLDHLRHDPAVLADLAVADESELFVRRESTVEKKAGRNGACVLRVALHPPPAEIRDEVERTRERRSRDTLAPMPLADEVARRPPVRQCRHALLIRGPVLDPRHLVGRAELAPAQAVVPIEHEGRMRRARPHASQLPLTLRRHRPFVVFVETHAPAAPEDPVIAFHQRGERRPGRLVQRLDGVLRHHGGP